MALSYLQRKMLKRLLQSGTEQKITHALEKIHPSDLIVLFSELNLNEIQRLIDSLLVLSKAGKVLKELPEFLLPDILRMMDDKKLCLIISRLDSDDALHLIEGLPEERRPIILESIPIGLRLKLDKLLLYPKDSAGSVMNTSFVIVRSQMTVEHAIESLRAHPEVEGIFYIYVVDDANRLVGVQSLRALVMSPSHKKVGEIMTGDVHAIQATASREEAAQTVAKYNLLALPVINERMELVGVITVDDVIDIVQQEATEDIYNLAGLSEEDRATTPLALKVKKRLPWMVANLFTAIVAAGVVSLFQSSIQKVVALAIFMPIVAGMGGNSASQSLTVITRSIALGELSFIRTYKAVLKEMGNGLIIGLLCGVLMVFISWAWMKNIYLGLVLLFAMVINLAIGGLMGALIPITLKKLNLDPAVGSSVVVTTFTDVCGFLAFLGIATLAMKYVSL